MKIKILLLKKLQCEGQLDWIEVSSSTRSYNVTLPSENVYQFAVAANTEKYSSGMVWATCTILHNKVVGKLKTVTVDVVKKESMLLRWRLDCSDRVGIVTGYAGKIFFRKQFQRDVCEVPYLMHYFLFLDSLSTSRAARTYHAA